MLARKRLAIALYCFGLSLVTFLSGCATTGSDPHSHGNLAHETKQFAPDERGGTSAKELRPVSNRGMVDLLREADASFQRASELEANGQKDAAATEYRHMLNLLAEADLDPATFTSTRKEFADNLARETKAAHRQHSGEVKPSAIKIPVPLPPAVLAQIERIQNDYPNSFQSALDRGQKYIPAIRERMRAAGLPEELAYVAMIESHFNEKIDSRAGAGGMWQFMPETGRLNGLRQDGFIDERYDWNAATEAAISYFTKLNSDFDGNWPLAIASYNCGEYGLQRAIDATGGERDFFRLIETEPASNTIKTETKDYYPKFLAYWIVSEHAERFGFSRNTPQPEPTSVMTVRGSYALDDLEEAMTLPEGTLARLNPSLVRQVTPPIGENKLRIPSGTDEKLTLALASVPQYGQGIRSHKVRRGETLASIAGKYGIDADDLKSENKLKTAKLHAGQTLKLPFAVPSNTAKGGRDDAPDPLVAAAKEEKAKRESAPVTAKYTVKSGDTLVRIAEKNGVTLDDLLKQNSLSRKSQIKAGQTLKIVRQSSKAPAEPIIEAKAAPAPKETSVEHTVAQGEYLAVVARKYGVSVADLETWNGLEKGETIRVGQTLTIKKAGAAPTTGTATAKASPAQRKTTVTVAAGDTPSKIAANNGVSVKDLLAWNNLSDGATIKVGQKLTVMGSGPEAASSEEEKDTGPVRLAKASAPAAPAAKSTAKSAAPPKTIHTVASGQTPTSIAKRYGVGVTELFKWNNWDKSHVLRPGDKVVVEKK